MYYFQKYESFIIFNGYLFYRGIRIIEAFVLITTDVGKLRNAYESVKKLKYVKKINIITGPYDILALFESDDISELRDVVVDSIRSVEGVKETTTAMIVEA